MSALELDRMLSETSVRPMRPVPPVEPLTAREIVVLRHLARPATLEDIAAGLWVSRNTVKSQVRSVYRKLGVSSRSDAVAWAEAAGL